jgi:predicted patatin/cPLA2 family phospholipase
MAKRALMLAGGGLKIAFQAGVLQVWLDEAGIEFGYGDGVSAACFNLAMWAQGMSGRQIADNWRNFNPITAVRPNWAQLVRLFWADSILKLDAFRERVFPGWGLDVAKIRAGAREAAFNVYDFSKHELQPVRATELTEDFLVATASLPLWFPPVQRGAWMGGTVGSFFGIFEATTNWAYKQMLTRIARNNEAVALGQPGEFGRNILVRELKSEVPLHYLLNFSQPRFVEAVELGVSVARNWCREQGIPCRRA